MPAPPQIAMPAAAPMANELAEDLIDTTAFYVNVHTNDGVSRADFLALDAVEARSNVVRDHIAWILNQDFSSPPNDPANSIVPTDFGQIGSPEEFALQEVAEAAVQAAEERAGLANVVAQGDLEAIFEINEGFLAVVHSHQPPTDNAANSIVPTNFDWLI